MFNLAYPIDDEINIDGFIGHVDMSYDNILRLFDLIEDEDIPELMRLDLALEMLLSASFICSYERRLEIYKEIVSGFIVDDKPTVATKSDDDDKEYFSLKEDAEYIYPSFMQDYRIDLFEQQGKLHWRKFKALLGGLREDTKFKKVVEIRQWKPSKDSSADEIKAMKELQRIYALNKTQEELEFEAMDLVQKREYAMRKLAEEGDEINS